MICAAMYRRTFTVGAMWFALAAVLMLVLAPPTRGAIPNADNPNAYTEHDRCREKLALLRSQSVERYKQAGHHDPKWDEPALALLDGVCKNMAYARVDAVYFDKPRTEPASLAKLGEQALKAGCDDPVVLDFYAVALADSGRDKQAILPIVTRAVDGLMHGPYPVFRLAVSARRARSLLDPQRDAEACQKYDRIYWDAAMTAIAQPNLTRADRRELYDVISRDYEVVPTLRKKELYEKAKAGNGDPWIVNLLGGTYHIKAAWDARGTGWANSVTEQGWKNFFHELAEARQCLTDAQQAHPELPEAATNMITVAMGSEKPGETTREWFDKAVQAQLDFSPAYNLLLYAMLPRWSGSHEAMYAFGVECADTGRYDTMVPFQLIHALSRIRADTGGDWSFFHREGVYDQATKVLAGYAMEPQSRNFDYYQSWIAGLAWQMNRWDDGRKALDKITAHGGKVNHAGLAQAETIPTRTASGLYALTGSNGTALRDAEQAAANGDHVSAATTYDKLAADMKPDNPALLFLRGRAAEHRWMDALDKAKDVDLTPGADLAGWYPVSGTWTASDDQVITATSDARGAVLVCGIPVGPAYQLSATMDLRGLHPSEAKPHPGAGLIAALAGPADLCMITVRPDPPVALAVTLRQNGTDQTYGQKTPPNALDSKENTLSLTTQGMQARVMLNQQQAIGECGLPEIAYRVDNRIGLVMESSAPGAVVRFSHVTAHKLGTPQGE